MVNYSVRYGASIRKRAAVVKAKKRGAYKCDACGKVAVKRIGTSIWKCRHCNATYAGGAYTMTTPEGEVARRLIEGIGKKRQ
jgi:large subunit ribosomal protein L37Ae